MTIYVPGVAETDPKKQNRSLQQLGTATSTNTTSIATNTADIATNTTNIATNTTNIATNTTNIATNTSAISALQTGPLTSGNVATQANQEAATSTTLAVTPGRQQYHPSAAKAWAHYQGTGTPAILASYNLSSVSRSAAGNYTFNWTTAFSSANYAAVVQGNDNTSGAASFALLETIAAGSVFLVTVNPSTLAQADASHVSVVAFGDQ